MIENLAHQLVLFIAGFVANILASLSGGGAGFVQLPVLIFMGLSFPLALGTHKVAVVALGIGAFAKNHKISSLNKTASSIFLLLGCPAVVIGSLLILKIDDWIAEIILGFLTLFGVFYSLFKKEFGLINRENELTLKNYIINSICVFFVGMLSGSFSSGAGIFAIILLILGFKMDIKKAIHHSMILVALIWNITGAITIGSMGQIHWPWVPMLVLGAFLGGFSGTILLSKLNVKIIKKLFLTVMFISAIMLLYKGYIHYLLSLKT
ncbi:MAG: sulfite exporter TauE/SafE family protein [Succinivibrionaceae bacterium]